MCSLSAAKIRPDSIKFVSNAEALMYLKKYEDNIKIAGSMPLLVTRVVEYLSKFSKIPIEKAPELREKLAAKGLKEKTIVMVMNICPKTVDELRSLMELEDKVYESSFLEELVSILSEYCVEQRS